LRKGYPFSSLYKMKHAWPQPGIVFLQAAPGGNAQWLN